MNRSITRTGFWTLALFLGMAGRAWCLTPSMDSILPADHLLENLPWMSEDGQVESKGLFDFEDVRGIGRKDLIFIYRQSVPVHELDKPHTQTFAVCFYDTDKNKYVKSLEEEGGTVKWVRLVKDPGMRAPYLFLERDDLKGSQVLKCYSFLSGGLKPVLETVSPKIFAKFVPGTDGTKILLSSKEPPLDRASAEHVYEWDPAKAQFAELTAVKPATPTPVLAVAAKPAPKAPVKAVKTDSLVWWDTPLKAQAALGKLRTELVPSYVKSGDIVTLGKKSTAFFAEVQKQGIHGKEFLGMRADYYAAVASAMNDEGRSKEAAYYLKIALKLQSDNPSAAALKGKIKP